MLVLQETTPWPFPLHIYFTDNSKRLMHAYINGITGEGKIFKAPIPMNPKGRQFEVIKRFHLED